MKIGNIIKEARIKAGLSQEELGSKVFVSKQSISKYENDNSIPSDEILFKLQEILNVKLQIDDKSGVYSFKKSIVYTFVIACAVILFILSFSIVRLNNEVNEYEMLLSSKSLDYNGIEISFLENTLTIGDKVYLKINIHNGTSSQYSIKSSLFTIEGYETNIVFIDDFADRYKMISVGILENGDYTVFLEIEILANSDMYFQSEENQLKYAGQTVTFFEPSSLYSSILDWDKWVISMIYIGKNYVESF